MTLRVVLHQEKGTSGHFVAGGVVFRMRMFVVCAMFGMSLSMSAQVGGAAPATVMQVLGVAPALEQLEVLRQRHEEDTAAALALRERVLERVLLASFDVDEMLGRIDAEAAHASDSRYVLEARKERRNAALNLATFAISGALGTAGSAMQLTSSLNHAGSAVEVAAGATALVLSTVQLKGLGTEKRVLLSPYNMLAQVLGQTPNAQSKYPPLVAAYLHTPASQDGQLPDGVAPDVSLPAAWHRLHLLEGGSGKGGARLKSVTTDPAQGEKLTAEELADRDAMLRDLHGAVSLLKVELRGVLLSMQAVSDGADGSTPALPVPGPGSAAH